MSKTIGAMIDKMNDERSEQGAKDAVMYLGIEYAAITGVPMYYVSRCGKVLSAHNNRYKVVNPRMGQKKYLFFNLTISGAKKFFYLHSLLKRAYLSSDSDGSSAYKIHINHIDGDKLNNDLSNLELIPMESNARHHRILTNPLGIGVTLIKKRNKYMAQIQCNKKRKCLGYFDMPQDAQDAYMDAFISLGLSDKHVEATGAYQRAADRAKGYGL